MTNIHEYLQSFSGGIFVEIGASSGGTTSPTMPYALKEKWSGIWIEADKDKYNKQVSLPDLVRLNMRVDTNSLVMVLKQFSIPKDFDYFVLDIDSFDYYVLLHVLSSGFRPKIIEVEINEKIPYPINFAVKYSEVPWDVSHFYGMSLKMLEDLCFAFEYDIIGFNAPNAILAPAGKFAKENIIPAVRQYCEAADFNQNVKAWWSVDSESARNAIREYFKPYVGRFILCVS